MERRFAKDVIGALTRLGCKDVSRYAVGDDVHVCGTGPDGTLIYLTSVKEAQSVIAQLAAARLAR